MLPVAVTENVTDDPAVTLWLCGWTVIVGLVLDIPPHAETPRAKEKAIRKTESLEIFNASPHERIKRGARHFWPKSSGDSTYLLVLNPIRRDFTRRF